MLEVVGSWLLTVIGTAVVLAAPLALPAVRDLVGKYVGGLVQHRFNEKIERLRSELRQSEATFGAELRANERQIKSLTDAALSLRSTRQAVLDARRLAAVEKIWNAKLASDRLKMGAGMVSSLNLDKLYEAAGQGDPKIKLFAETLMAGIDIKKDLQELSALSERPFLPPELWALFSAYQGVLIHSIMHLQVIALGATRFMKREDALKPLMLAALPEHKDYIEKFGFGGYFYLLDVLEQKLLLAIVEVLEGRDLDEATLKRTAEIIAAGNLLTEQDIPRGDIPQDLRAPRIPDPPRQ